MMMGTGLSELLVILLLGGATTGGGILGYPPGERDAAFVRAAPVDALIYAEWAERSAGTPGAEGVDGLAADPEIKLFVERVEQAILRGIASGADDPEEQILAKSIPAIVKAMLVRPGCMYASFDEQAAARAIEQSGGQLPTRAAAALGIEAAIMVNAGDGADEFAKHVNALLDLNSDIADRNHDLDHQIIPLPIPARLEIHREGTYFILAFGETVAADAVKAITDDTVKGIAANERYTEAMSHVATDRVATVGWIDVKKTLAAVVGVLEFQGLIVKQVSESLGLDAVDSVATVNGIVEGRMSSRTFVTTGGSVRGLLALVDGRPLTGADLAEIPADADLVYAFTLDTKKVMAAVREIVVKSDPSGFAAQQMNKTLEQLDKELGFSIENDVFEAFGDVWTFHDSPSSGGFVVTGLVGSLEVRDHERAKVVYAKLMELTQAALPGIEQGQYRRSGAELRREEFLDHEIAFINTMDDDIPFAPAFCLTKTRLLVAPNPQAIKAQLRFVASDEENFGEHLAERVPLGEGTAVCVTYVDLRRAIEMVHTFVPYIGQTMMGAIQSQGGDITAFSIPSSRAILPYAKDSFGRTVRTDDGILMEYHNGAPVPGITSFMFQLPMFGVRTFRSIGGAIPAPRAMAAPVQMRAVPAQAVPVQKEKVEAVRLKEKIEAAKRDVERAAEEAKRKAIELERAREANPR